MTYRKISTSMWCDPWFEKISNKAKLLFIYLVTNTHTDAAGMVELSDKRISLEVGISESDVNEIAKEIGDKVVSARGFFWVKNFYRHQKCNPKFETAALTAARKTPFYHEWVNYNELSGHPKYNRTEQNRDGGIAGGIAEGIRTVSDTVSDTVSNSEPPRKKFQFDPPHLEFAKFMFGKIREVAPSTKEPNFEAWADCIRKLNKIDNIEGKRIKQLFEWANSHQFWGSIILSPGNLRDKWAQIEAQMLRDTAKGSKEQKVFITKDTFS